MVDFELLDIEGNELLRQRLPLEPDRAVDPVDARPARNSAAGRTAEPTVLVGSAVWRPPLADVGFYRVRVSMSGRRDAQHQREISLALIREQKKPARGEFGWTLPNGEKPLTLGELANLVQHSGINWLKFPVWDGSADALRNDRLVWFSERLQIEGVELIGLLVDPPNDVRSHLSDAHLSDAEKPAAAQIFSTEPEIWYPSLEPIATRLSLKVRWWQLGRDDDLSFVNYPQLPATINRVRKQLALRPGRAAGLRLVVAARIALRKASLGFCFAFRRSAPDCRRTSGILGPQANRLHAPLGCCETTAGGRIQSD